MFYISHDPKTTLKSRLEIVGYNVLMLPYNYTRNQYGRHYIALPKFVLYIPQVVYRINVCRYITPLKTQANKQAGKQRNEQINKQYGSNQGCLCLKSYTLPLSQWV